MKLKKILQETFDYKSAQELYRTLVDDGYKIDLSPSQLIYRGVSSDVSDWTVRGIRKNREPRNTYPYFDMLIYQIEDHLGSRVPRRRHSKFASGKREIADEFGDVYLCFPEQNANIVSFPQDTYDYFYEAQDYLHEVAYDFYEIESDPSIETGNEPLDTFLVYLTKLVFDKNSVAAAYVADYIYNEHETIIDQAENYIQNTRGSQRLDLLEDAINSIWNYIDDMQPGVVPNSGEVIFDGDSYVLVDEEFFKEYFEWGGSNWKLKAD